MNKSISHNNYFLFLQSVKSINKKTESQLIKKTYQLIILKMINLSYYHTTHRIPPLQITTYHHSTMNNTQ